MTEQKFVRWGLGVGGVIEQKRKKERTLGPGNSMVIDG